MTKPNTDLTEPAALPSMHVDHSANFANELDVKIMGYTNALLAITADLEGMQEQHDREAAERAASHAAAMDQRYRLKRDVERSHAMAEAARAVYVADLPVQGDDA